MSTPPFKVKAVYEYTSPHEDDLHFPNGQIITVVEDDEDDWYTGEYTDASGVKQEGIFPRNFVEKYEPTAPPRPNRAPRPKKEEAQAQESTEDHVAVPESPKDMTSTKAEAPVEAQRTVPQLAPQVLSPPATSAFPAAESAGPVQSHPKSANTSKPAPPPVSDKPTGGSFRDRIAAFNKPAAAPVTPFKPSGLGSLGSSGFIKKPFVAPPPSKDAYVPVAREAPPQKVYKREEDPEIAERESETREMAERAGLAANENEGEDEDQPKPTSLKDRIALLQKQQMEQAARHAEAAQKKEKPKKPAKRRTDSLDPDAGDDSEGVALERQDTQDTIGKGSMTSQREDELERAPLPRRKSSKGPGVNPTDSTASGNEADMSGAGDETEEPEEISTSRDDSDERPKARAPLPALPARAPAAPLREPDVGDEEGLSEEEPPVPHPNDVEEFDEEEEDVDPEIRRKEELRARMAKMSGGMGMHGMFGPPSGMGMPMPGAAMPAKKKQSSSSAQPRPIEEPEKEDVPIARAPPIPMPGLSRVRSPEDSHRPFEVQREATQDAPITSTRRPTEVVDVEDIKPAPPVPGGRPAPPPVPSESRPQAPQAPQVPMSPSPGSESDDERSIHTPKLTLATNLSERSPPTQPSGAPAMPSRPAEELASSKSPSSKRVSHFSPTSNPTSPTTPGESKRVSRMPPIPGSIPPVPAAQIQSRAPPPPPPTVPSLSRSSTGDARVLESPERQDQDESDEEITEYEGDYDTDIAPTASHKEALKTYTKESNVDDVNFATRSPTSPGLAPPPPPFSTHRALPPPLPSQPPPVRQSVDIPRAAPPPPPVTKAYNADDDEYDPYNYSSQVDSPAPTPGISRQRTEEDYYGASPPRALPPMPSSQERSAPPPPPRETAPHPGIGRSRPSTDIQRSQPSVRRSTDLTRMSMDTGVVAMDVDLAEGSRWWTTPNGVPPVFQNRKDILYETEESTATKRGGKTTMTKDVYVLFQDYSQTIITVNFDAQTPADANLEQRHEQPPSRLRQDQLEAAWERFGHKIGEAVAQKKDSVVGDGSSFALVTELLKPFTDALLPVGTRAYGALVYANLANASVSQFDEIRPGDVITLRNAKLQGKHGAMHAKYSTEVGAGIGHVGVVAEWDGTKKKVRAWEQGRENKKVKLESFKLDDLRSGEVKIWRVMPRSWVGWEGVN